MRTTYLALVTLIACGNGPAPKHTTDAIPRDAAISTADGSAMQQAASDDDFKMVRNDLIKFGNYRPPEATMATRQRKVMVIGPPEAVRLAHSGDLHVVDRLLPLLTDPDRAWAAEVMLSAMTGNDSDLVIDYDGQPRDFFNDYGPRLKDLWEKWLAEYRGKLQWDDTYHRFVVKD